MFHLTLDSRSVLHAVLIDTVEAVMTDHSDLAVYGTSSDLAKAAMRSTWRPVQVKVTVFVQQHIDCPACRAIRKADRRSLNPLFHVHRCDQRLVITEADDLHRPGRSLVGLLEKELADGAMFRLFDQLPFGIAAGQFRPGQGTALFTRRQGRWGLIVAGSSAGLIAHDGVLIEASEIDA